MNRRQFISRVAALAAIGVAPPLVFSSIDRSYSWITISFPKLSESYGSGWFIDNFDESRVEGMLSALSPESNLEPCVVNTPHYSYVVDCKGKSPMEVNSIVKKWVDGDYILHENGELKPNV